MSKKQKIEIPEWFEPRLRETLGHLKWVLGDEESKPLVPTDKEVMKEEIQDIADSIAPIYHPTLADLPDEDKVFFALVLRAVKDNGVDISKPQKVNAKKIFVAYQEEKESFFKLCEEDTNPSLRHYWTNLQSRL